MRKLLFILLSSVVISNAFSQNRMITGKVTDEKGNQIPGASILAKGTNIGTSAGTEGAFIISIPPSCNTLVISSINFITLEVPVTDFVAVRLKPSAGTLSEVVVTGYSPIKKTNLTGSIARVNMTEIENKPLSSVDKMLQGSIAGVQSLSFSGAPGSSTDILIRGFSVVTSNPNPLWVIDGAIATTGNITSQNFEANALSSLNPDDIESINVLKDAASSAIYGSRAANGVILVTTKKGKAGKTAINFSTEIGRSSIAYKPGNKPANSIQSQTLLREAVINAGIATDNATADAFITSPTGLGINPDYTKTNTDWLDVVSRPGSQEQYNLSLTGGDTKTQFYASGGYFNQVGTAIGANFKRYNGNLTLTHKVTDKLVFNAGINGSSSKQNTPLPSFFFANPVFSQLALLPWYSPYNADGSFRYNDAEGQFPLRPGLFNPVIINAWNKNNIVQTVMRGNISGEYKILENLLFTSRYSAEYFVTREDFYQNPLYGDGYPAGYAKSSSGTVFDWTWSNFANFKQSLNKEKDIYLVLEAGYEAYQQKVSTLSAEGKDFPATLALQYLASAATPVRTFSNITGNTTNSLFSNANLNYKDRYVLSGSFRRDASSRFGANNKWANFYSVGASWNVNEENFLKNSKLFNLLKLRSSYGQNGNQSIGDYTSLTTFGYGFNYAGNPGSALTNVGNPDLTWEKSSIINIGVDFGMLMNRFFGTVEVYNRTTSDLIENVPLSLTSGLQSQNRNAAKINNKGVELTLGGMPVVTRDFNWNISFNIAHNIQEVKKLYQGKPVSFGVYNVTEGRSSSEWYMPQWAGVNPADGTPLWYTDETHSTTTKNYNEAKQAFSGKFSTPRYYGALTNTFSYKGFSLQVQLFYNYGNYLANFAGGLSMSDGQLLGIFNQLTDELSSWKKPGDQTNTPKIILGGNNNANALSTRYLNKGDYIRVKNAELGYTIPGAVLKRLHIANVTVYVRGTNLFTHVGDKHLPMDPEQGVYNWNLLNVYMPKFVTGGIKIRI